MKKNTAIKTDYITAEEIEESPKLLGLKSLISNLPPDVRKDVRIKRSLLSRINFTLEHMTTGLSSKVAMICTGPKCCYKDTCPLIKAGVIGSIIGNPCPIESQMVELWKGEYIAALDVNPENKIEMDRVSELIEADIIDMRTSGILSVDGIFDYQPVGVDRHGETITRKEIGVAIHAKMLFKDRKDKIIKEFMATREMRAKYRVNSNVDPSTYSANLMQAASRYSRDIEEAEWDERSEEEVQEDGAVPLGHSSEEVTADE